jgi:Fanconi anemia group M protein
MLEINDNKAERSYFRKYSIETRKYQTDIARQCVSKNSLVVLPTGLGKTIIAVIVAGKTLELYPNNSKIIILAPTRPLINQHYESFRKFLTIQENQFEVLTGKIVPDKRVELFHNNRLLFYTPQTLRNDITTQKYTLEKVCLIVFDEAHHATGDYAYCLISDEYVEQNPDGNILALTASPGASKEKIKILCENLHVKSENIHTRTRRDGDVKSYLQPLDIYKVGVDLTESMDNIYQVIRVLLEERLRYLSQTGFIDKIGENLVDKIIRKDLLRLNSELVKKVNSDNDKTGVYSALSINAQCLILFHILELIEQQGLDVLLIYLSKLKQDARKKNSSKAVKILASDMRLHKVYLELKKAEDIYPESLIHPKYAVMLKIITDELQNNPQSRILVFVKLRDSVKNIVDKLKLNGTSNIRPSRFVGQSSKSKDDKGLSQKKQLEILERFKQGELNILVSTNVGEEGLDIAECDLVLFYDVVASEIRFIQRRGRTARHRKGKVIVLYCKKTHDEVYMRIALSKLRRMNVNLKDRDELKESYNRPIPEKQIILTETKSDSKPKYNLTIKKSSIDYFISKSQAEVEKIHNSIILSYDFPVKFGMRNRLRDENIKFGISHAKEHMVLFDKVLLQIIQPLINPPQPFPDLIKIFKARYKLVIILFDFVGFEEAFPGQERLLKEKIKRLGETHSIQAIALDNPEELFFIVKNIYEHGQKEVLKH